MTAYNNITAMTEAEAKRYRESAKAWMENPEDLTEGMRLLTAIPQAKLFLSYAKCYDDGYKRREIMKLLQGATGTKEVPARDKRHGAPANAVSGTKATVKAMPGGAGSTQKGTTVTTSAGTVYTYDDEGNILSVGGARPNHFDEWKHMMPAILQDKIDTLDANFTHMLAWRQRMEILAADPNHSQTELSRAATLTRNYEAKNLNIFAQADVCWDELAGKAVSDETKQILLQEEAKIFREIALGEQEPCTTPEAPQEDASKDSTAGITADQAQKYIRDKFDPDNASEAQVKKALEYAELILREKGKLSKKVKEKIDRIKTGIQA